MEERFPVLTGAEPFFIKGNSIGILISHGFGGTPQSVRDLGKSIAAQGYTVYAPRLKGHGTHWLDLENCTYQEWIKNLDEAYLLLQKYCRTIFVIGQSMGGTLTVKLASKYPLIKGIVLINAAMTTIPTMDRFLNRNEPRYLNEGSPDIKARDAIEITYSKTPIKSIRQLLYLMDHTRGKLQNVTCPTLAFRSIEDHVVPPENTVYILDHLNSEIKESISLYNSYHVASMDHEKQFVSGQCCRFIEEVLSRDATVL